MEQQQAQTGAFTDTADMEELGRSESKVRSKVMVRQSIAGDI